MQEDN